MKKINLLILLLFFNGLLISQDLIIGDPVLSGGSIPLTDTTVLFLDCDGSVYYEIDLDGDENFDVHFDVNSSCGGSYSHNYVRVKTINNNFSVHIDTNYQGLIPVWDTINNDWIYVPETYTVIKEYKTGDTIFHNEISTTNQYKTLFESSWHDANGEWLHTTYIGQFYGDTCYVSFTKNNEDSTSLYYIEVFLDTDGLHLISAKSNGSPSKIDEKIANSIYFYPNPVVSIITIKENYKEFEVFTLQGSLVLNGEIPRNDNTLDLSSLKPGYYLLRLKNKSKEVVTKFIKQ